jgi:hypothetical protein
VAQARAENKGDRMNPLKFVVYTVLALAFLALVIVPNYFFWEFIFTLDGIKFLAMVIVWLLLGTWTSAIGLYLAGAIFIEGLNSY